MTKLSRNPDWMGFNSALQRAERLRFLVYPQYRDSRLPGYPVGYPAEESLGDDRDAGPFPEGQAILLRDVLTWHGAAECRWIVRRPA